jgi:hypothetical protein
LFDFAFWPDVLLVFFLEDVLVVVVPSSLFIVLIFPLREKASKATEEAKQSTKNKLFFFMIRFFICLFKTFSKIKAAQAEREAFTGFTAYYFIVLRVVDSVLPVLVVTSSDSEVFPLDCVLLVLFVLLLLPLVVSISSLLPLVPIVVPLPSELLVEPVVVPDFSFPDVELLRFGLLSSQLPTSAQVKRPPATAVFKFVIFILVLFIRLIVFQDRPAALA